MIYKNLVPKDSFIGQYMEYMSEVETPDIYDFWCGIWAIGVCCGRNVIVDRPRAPIHLNWYVILSAESGTTRKSTAVREISSIVESTKLSDGLSAKTSPEQLTELLATKTRSNGEARLYIAASELVTILGREGYLINMPGLLTHLYDCPDYDNAGGRIDGLERILKGVYINLLSASTPSWLVTSINPAVIEGGFTSRVIFVGARDRKKAIAWPKITDSERQRQDLSAKLISISEDANSVGSIGLNKGGLERYTSWYRKRHSHKDAYRASFEAREDDHVLKLAACLSINDNTFRIETSHINRSIDIISGVKESAFELFGDSNVTSTSSRIHSGIDRVRQILIEVGMDGIRHNELYKRVRNRVDSKEFNLLMTVMHEAGMIQRFEIKGTRGIVYRGNRGMESLDVTTKILSKVV